MGVTTGTDRLVGVRRVVAVGSTGETMTVTTMTMTTEEDTGIGDPTGTTCTIGTITTAEAAAALPIEEITCTIVGPKLKNPSGCPLLSTKTSSWN